MNILGVHIGHDSSAALLKDGKLLACGKPTEVMTGQLLGELFGTSLLVDAHPVSGNPRVSWTI